MILSVCPHTALDRVMIIDEWIPGTPMRTERLINCVGGKGLDSAVVLNQLEVDTLAMGFIAGKVGRELLELLEEYGIRMDPIWVDGSNRVAHVIAERKKNIHNHVIAGKVLINEEQEQEFIDKYRRHLEETDFVIIAGSIPPVMCQDFSARLVRFAKEANVPILVDSQKQAMIEVVKEKPDIVKMNWEEFEWTFNLKAEDLKTLTNLAKEFYREHQLENLVLTLSKEGILSVTPQGTFLTKAPFQKPRNAAGAGDAVSSALVWRLSEGDDWLSAMKWAGAVSAACVLTERTGDVHKEDVMRILPQVTIEEL